MTLILERGALARSVGPVVSLLHRPGLCSRDRCRAISAILAYLAARPEEMLAYQDAVGAVLDSQLVWSWDEGRGRCLQ